MDILAFLACDLQTPRLDGIHKYLWLAGLMQPARELHRQRLLGRTICITERPEEHLVWHESTIFIKPLPEYLLSHAFWTTSICPHEPLYRSALGLLWSYIWLVRTKPDLKIAHETGLLPADIHWASWSRIARDILALDDDQMMWREVGPRYAYGELRLTRLNALYRLGFTGFSPRNLVRAYMTGSQRYTTLFQRNFGWLLAVFVYITVVLSGMQVALATGRFADDQPFQELCYVVSLASMVLVVAAIVVVFIVWLGLFCFHLLSTIFFHKRIRARREKAASSS
ncbi:hypothetical protein Micbo1qcDRAFT_124912 [Microdochium bolleyi]|uniref:Uncharacterized protein n=1 Tax=Microdochium bolleyi TaxID=196109 RepID=A0A136IQQ3_9PEZI|nr:hypothetical protein Micbo1qcDRAFT_124912 [Microdochium bolleyi]